MAGVQYPHAVSAQCAFWHVRRCMGTGGGGLADGAAVLLRLPAISPLERGQIKKEPPSRAVRAVETAKKTRRRCPGQSSGGWVRGGTNTTAPSINRILKLFESFKIRTAGRQYFFDTLNRTHAQ